MINEIQNLNNLIKAQKEYITFLEQDINSHASFLAVHHIDICDAMYEKGVKLRKEIKDLEITLGIKE